MTKQRTHKHAGFIRALGGHERVAEFILVEARQKVAPTTVRMWMYRGIPHRYRGTLIQFAAAQGVTVPRNFLGAE